MLVFWLTLLNWYLELNWNCCSSSWTGKTSLLSKSEYILLQTRYHFQKFEAMQYSVDLTAYQGPEEGSAIEEYIQLNVTTLESSKSTILIL